jgi:hypothetical protein
LVLIWHPVQHYLAAALIALSCSGALAAEPLNSKEWSLEAAWLFVGFIEYGQTLDIKNHPDLYERNPFLGKHPSDARVRNYHIVAGLAHVGMTRLLPREYRPYWQWGTLILEIGLVERNHRLGLRLDF